MKEPREFWLYHVGHSYGLGEGQGLSVYDKKQLGATIHVREVFDEPVDPYAELKKAQKEGKVIQVRVKESVSDWFTSLDPQWYPEYEYRIKPEPKYRSWTAEEVPVGAMIRDREGEHSVVWAILYVVVNKIAYGRDFFESNEWVLKTKEHSLDHGKIWLPCGVLISE
jgi:hypothetical protein